MKKNLLLISIFIFFFQYQNLFPSQLATESTYNLLFKNLLLNYNSTNVKNFKKSKKNYENLLKKFPENSEIKTDYFVILTKSEQFQEAYIFFEKNCQDSKFLQRQEFLLCLGNVLIYLKKYEDANFYLEKGEILNSDDENFKILLGISNYKLKNYEKALSYFEKGENFFHDEKLAVYLADTYYKLGDLQKSAESLEQLKNSKISEKEYFSVLLDLAGIYEETDKRLSEKYYQEITKYHDGVLKAKALNKIANLAFSNAEFDKSKYFFQESLKSAKKSQIDLIFDSCQKLNLIFATERNFKRAIFYKEKAINLLAQKKLHQKNTPLFSDDIIELCKLYENLNYFREKENVLKKFYNETKSEKLGFYLAKFYFSRNDFEKTILIMPEILNLSTEHKKEYYENYLKFVKNCKNLNEKNIEILQFKNKNIESSEIQKNLKNYLEVLNKNDLIFFVKTNFNLQDFSGKIFMDFTYEATKKFAKIKLFLTKKSYFSNVYFESKKLYADKNVENFLDVDFVFADFKSFLKIFDLGNLENLKFQEKTKEGLFFKLNDFSLLTDFCGNLKFLEFGNTKIEFYKVKNLVLPTKISVDSQKASFVFDYENFEINYQNKEFVD